MNQILFLSFHFFRPTYQCLAVTYIISVHSSLISLRSGHQMNREFDRQAIPVRQRTPSKRVRTAWPRRLTESISLTRAKMLSIKGPDTCTFDQTTRPTTSREILAKPVHVQEVSSSFSSANLFTITPAHLPDCSSNFIEVVLQVLRLCIDSYIQVSSFLSLPRQCIRRALATCRLPFAVSFASPPPRFLPQPFLHSLFLHRCLDAFCRIFLVSSSNFFNTEQFVRFYHKKIVFCQQPQLMHCMGDFFSFHFGLGAPHWSWEPLSSSISINRWALPLGLRMPPSRRSARDLSCHGSM